LAASALNSSVYLLLPINISLITVIYGLEMSTKVWSIQSKEMSHALTAEDLYEEMKQMPASERNRFFR
jgi:hypothetical protein